VINFLSLSHEVLVSADTGSTRLFCICQACLIILHSGTDFGWFGRQCHGLKYVVVAGSVAGSAVVVVVAALFGIGSVE
jgi:hypothetical protein